MSWDEARKRIFESHFKDLQGFLKKFNRWPAQRNTTGLEHELAVWFLDLRYKYKANKLPDYALAKLTEIGFPFKPYAYHWEQTYLDLKKHIKENKKFPCSTDQSLYSWLYRQLYAWDELEAEQRKALRELGVSNKLTAIKRYGSIKNALWEVKLSALLDYYEKNKKIPSLGENTELSLWCSNQRNMYSLGKLSEERIKRLSAIHFFDFNKDRKWSSLYKQLCVHLKINKTFPTKGYLATWCSYNRQWYHGRLSKFYGEYPKDRKKQLDELGFNWDLARKG